MEVFKPEHKEQPVNTQREGNGRIIEVTDDGVMVMFEINLVDTFLLDGRRHEITQPELVFGHKDFSQFNYGTPVRNKLEFTGMPVWCWIKPKDDVAYSSPRLVIGTYLDGDYAFCEGGDSNGKMMDYVGSAKYAYQLTDEELEKNGLTNPKNDTNKQRLTV